MSTKYILISFIKFCLIYKYLCIQCPILLLFLDPPLSAKRFSGEYSVGATAFSNRGTTIFLFFFFELHHLSICGPALNVKAIKQVYTTYIRKIIAKMKGYKVPKRFIHVKHLAYRSMVYIPTRNGPSQSQRKQIIILSRLIF